MIVKHVGALIVIKNNISDEQITLADHYSSLTIKTKSEMGGCEHTVVCIQRPIPK